MNVVFHLSKKALFYKRKNLFVLSFSIILVAVLFSVIFSIASSLIQFEEISYQLAAGSDFHANLYNVTDEDIKVLNSSKELKESYIVWEHGELSPVRSQGNTDSVTLMSLESEEALNHMFVTLEEGRYPLDSTEILVEKEWLISLGIEPKIGMKIAFLMSENSATQSDGMREVEYTLSGYYSRKVDRQANRCAFTKDIGVGQRMVFLRYYNSINIEGKTTELTKKLSDGVEYHINDAFVFARANSITPTFICFLLLSIGIVFLCGYLIIYNFYAITISQDLKQYGLLKTMGMSERQLYQMGFVQVNIVYLLSIPLGALLGYMIGWRILSPLFMNLSGYDYSFAYDYSIWIPVLIVIFTYITAICSSIRPIKRVIRMSCLQAMNEETNVWNKRRKSITYSYNQLFQMAFGNIVREPRKTIVVVLSIAMSAILLMMSTSFANFFMQSQHIRKADICIASNRVLDQPKNQIIEVTSDQLESELPRYELSSYVDIPMPEESYAAISQLEGAIEAIPIYTVKYEMPSDWIQNEEILQMIERNHSTISVRVVSVPESIGQYLNTKVMREGNLDKNFFKEKEIIINSYKNRSTQSSEEDSYYTVREKLQLGNHTYEVTGITSGYLDFLGGFGYENLYGVYDLVIYMSESNFMKEYSDIAQLMSVDIFIDEDQYESIRTAVDHYEAMGLAVLDKKIMQAEMNQRIESITIIGLSLSVLVLMVGVMNYLNVVICGMYARQHELALLEVVGMTRMQTTMMLMYENLIYLLLFTVVSICLGVPFVKLVGILGKVSLETSIQPIFLMLGIMIGVCLVAINLSLRVLESKTSIERLRV